MSDQVGLFCCAKVAVPALEVSFPRVNGFDVTPEVGPVARRVLAQGAGKVLHPLMGGLDVALQGIHVGGPEVTIRTGEPQDPAVNSIDVLLQVGLVSCCVVAVIAHEIPDLNK